MKWRTFAKLGAILVGAGLLFGLLALAWVKYAPRETPKGQPPLAVLDASSLQDFRDTFNAGSDGVRILVMLSPT